MSAKRRHPLALSAVIAIALSGLSACTGEDPTALPPAGSTADPASTTVAATSPTAAPSPSGPPPLPPLERWEQVWSVNDPVPLGQPVAAGGIVLVHTTTNNVVHLGAIDPATGSSMWRVPVSIGGRPQGQRLSITVIGDSVVYLQPDPDDPDRGRVVVAPATTGQPAVLADQVYEVTETPENCEEQICFTATLDGVRTKLQMDPVTGAITPAPEAAAVPNSRDIGGEGLLSIADDSDGTEYLARVLDGSLLWKVGMEQALGEHRTSDGGWNWTFDEDAEVFHGTVGLVDESREGELRRPGKDLAQWGVDGSTGEVLWQEEGVDVWCGDDHASYSGGEQNLRCRWSPETTLHTLDEGTDNARVVVEAGELSIESFDPATGSTLWSAELGDRAGTEMDTPILTLLDSDRVAVQQNGRPMILDLRDGSLTEPANDPVGTCVESITSPIWGQGHFFQDWTWHNEHFTGRSGQPCGVDGTLLSAAPTWPADLGATIGEVRVVTTPTGLAGFRLTTTPGPTAPLPEPVPAPAAPYVPPTPTSTAAVLWTASGFEALSQPVVSGTTALLYGGIDEQLVIAAVDTATGAVKWTAPSQLTDQQWNMTMTVPVVGSRAVRLHAEADGGHRYVILDVETGAEVYVSPGSYQILSAPETCGEDVCLQVSQENRIYTKRLDLLTGLLADDPVSLGGSSGSLGAGLVPLTTDEGSVVAKTGRDSVEFSVPSADLVATDQDASRGYALELPGTGVTALFPGRPRMPEGTPPADLALGSRVGMVGIDSTTGAKLWESIGTDRSCLPWELSAGAPLLRCAWTLESVGRSGDYGLEFVNAGLSLQGFDPATGAATWTVPVSLPSDQAVQTIRVTDNHQLLALTPTGPVRISLIDGSVAPEPDPTGAVSTCISTLELVDSDPRGLEPGQTLSFRPTGTSLDWCSGDFRRPVAAAAGTTWPTWAGAFAGTTQLIVTRSGLQAFTP